MTDTDGDGIPEVAFQSSFAMQPANSAGLNWIAHSAGDPRQPWKAQKIDQFPTSHHVAWADLDGDGKKELLNAPLLGEKSAAPTYDQDKASVFWYSPKDWKRHVVTAEIPGIIHRVRPVIWDGGKREQFLVASFEGIALYRASGSGDAMKFEKQLLTPGHVEKAPRLGASDVGVGRQDGKRFFASSSRGTATRSSSTPTRAASGSAASSSTRSGAATRSRSSTSMVTAATMWWRTTTAGSPSRTRTRRLAASTCSSHPPIRRPANGSTGGSKTRPR
jgi:hypothetical protein